MVRKVRANWIKCLDVFPGVYFAVALTPEQLQAEAKIMNANLIWPKFSAHVDTLTCTNSQNVCFILTVADCKDKTWAQICALVSHEMLHVFDKLKEQFDINIYDHTNIYLFQKCVQSVLEIMEKHYGSACVVC